MMEQNTYIKERLDDQIAWYDNKSQSNQRWYKRLRVIELIAGACIPFLAAYITEASLVLKVGVGFLGLLITLITGVVTLYKFQENWIEYRTTCETLKHERFLFLTQTDPYDVADPFKLLVQRVENLISKENTQWAKHIKSSAKEKKKD
jgi:uncharacterized metal-binding protein